MRVTEKQLIDAGCCQDGTYKYFRYSGRKRWDADKLLKLAIRAKDYRSAATAISKMMNRRQRVTWAIWCAERVINIYEDSHIDDSRPRDAIKAAKAWLKNPAAANAAANAANAAANAAAYAAYAAAYAYAYERKKQAELFNKYFGTPKTAEEYKKEFNLS